MLVVKHLKSDRYLGEVDIGIEVYFSIYHKCFLHYINQEKLL